MRRRDQQPHVGDVDGVSGASPLVGAARLGADQRVGSAATFGLVGHVEPVAVDDPMNVPAQLFP